MFTMEIDAICLPLHALVFHLVPFFANMSCMGTTPHIADGDL